MNRTTRRLTLTEAGTAYLERARQILADVDEANAAAGATAREVRGTVRLRLPPAVAVHQIAKHLPRLHALHPKLSIEVEAFGPVETVDDSADLSIVWTREPTEGEVVARRLARTEVILCAAPEYLDRRGRPQHPRELASHAAMIPPVPALQRGLLLHHSASGETVAVDPQSALLRSTHVDTNYAAALAGLGITGLPSFVAADALLEGALERVLPHWTIFQSTLWAMYPSRKHLPARTRAVLDFLVEIFGGEDRDPWLAAAGCETQGAAAAPTLETPPAAPTLLPTEEAQP
jgi:DNA-binding transcriptional LysR family regulator